MKRLLLSYLIIALLLIAFSLQANAQSPNAENGLYTAINQELEKTFKPNEPGAAVIVVKDGKTILRKGYGMASMELGVPIEPDMIFRIGSVTKQFTAVAILMLMEQGKLSLTDEITKFLPDYPTQGKKITVEHLLTHTSGIKSYTSLLEWRPQMRKDVLLTEMIDVFKNKPMEFAPGEQWNYNNSGFVLLGAIIEKASGEKYADFIEKRIFAPLEMTRSFYDSTSRIIPHRAAGYSKNKDGYVNADYLSMTWPHAAGSLISTVDDLAKWDAALYTDKIVKQESLKRAWTAFVLNDGRATKYGYGWFLSTLQGHREVGHGGGINGFTCASLRLPDDHVYIAILTNRNTGTSNLEEKIAALVIGKPLVEPTAITLSPDALDQYKGTYLLNEKDVITITRENDKLFLRHPFIGRIEILPISETEFFDKSEVRTRVHFMRGANGAISSLTLQTAITPDDFAKKSSKPTPEPKEVSVDPAVFDRYTGEYELMPNLILTISRDGDKLMGQATGQSKLQLHPESVTKFFVKETNAVVEFVVEGDKATSLILHQGGQDLPAKKIK